MRIAAALSLLALAATHCPASSRARTPEGRVAAGVMALTREAVWTPVAAIRLPFRTFHPQGLVKIGADFYLSSVEVRVPPKATADRPDGHERDTGEGVGHLFRFGPDGALKGQVTLGEGAAYHPGGLDFDGRRIWVPVAEYRPDSRAILYTVDPVTLKAAVAFRFPDHIGAVALDRARGELHGLSWGSRRFYRWRVSASLRGGAAPPRVRLNRSFYVDDQDCHGVGDGYMLCGGVSELRAGGGERFALGGLELRDLRDDRVVWETPVPLRSPTGRPMTQNSVFVEATAEGLRAYFVPDDDASTLFIYDVAPPRR